MRHLRLCAIFSLLPALGAAAEPAPSGLSKEEVAEGFVSIFDGKSLDGWKGATTGYTAEDGLLVCQKKGGGNLFTTKEFGDFTFRFEFKLEAGGNNGVSVRGHEIQILDDYAPQYKNIKPCQYHGSIYCKVPAKRGATKKAGEWNTEEISVRGTRWRVTVNGQLIVDADIATVAGLEGVAKRTRAPLGFLGHGSRVEFRNLRVREEPAGEDLLAGGDLTKHWTTKGNWKLADGVVSLEPRPGEKGWQRYDAYLWAKKEYRDFEAEFEYKVQKGGNSGFYFHVGDVKSPVATGIEVQIYDSGSKAKDAKLSDHDSGGIIPGIPPTRNAAKPAGEWNKFRITCQGGKVTVVLNGEVVNEVSLDNPKIKSRPASGAIGFQDHGLPLALRNIRIRELGK